MAALCVALLCKRGMRKLEHGQAEGAVRLAVPREVGTGGAAGGASGIFGVVDGNRPLHLPA